MSQENFTSFQLIEEDKENTFCTLFGVSVERAKELGESSMEVYQESKDFINFLQNMLNLAKSREEEIFLVFKAGEFMQFIRTQNDPVQELLKKLQKR